MTGRPFLRCGSIASVTANRFADATRRDPMDEPGPLAIDYGDHPAVRQLRTRLQEFLEAIALDFDRWDESRVFGPGAYVAIVVGPSLEPYADPMGDNRWPSEAPVDVNDDPEGCFEGLETVSYECDGALVVSVDGIIQRQFVRFRNTGTTNDHGYADWMGARHMSALDVSSREDVVATLTLSQEAGRVTVFQDGSYESTVREQLGDPWRGSV